MVMKDVSLPARVREVTYLKAAQSPRVRPTSLSAFKRLAGVDQDVRSCVVSLGCSKHPLAGSRFVSAVSTCGLEC